MKVSSKPCDSRADIYRCGRTCEDQVHRRRGVCPPSSGEPLDNGDQVWVRARGWWRSGVVVKANRKTYTVHFVLPNGDVHEVRENAGYLAYRKGRYVRAEDERGWTYVPSR